MPLRIQPWLLLCAALTLGGCTAPAPPPAPPAAPAPELDPDSFQGETAWGHLEALAAIGPREMATEGSARAREYIVSQLEALGLEVVDQTVIAKRASGEAVSLHNVAAAVPGESTDLLLVIAPYDTRGFDGFENLGVNDGGSGVAVGLELARLIQRRPLPYTTWFVFLEGEQEARGSITSAHVGFRGLVARLEQRGAIEQVRLAVVVNRVCDPDLHIARDLGSHRVYREEFFQAADRLGFAEAFDAEGGFESPDEGQSTLISAGLMRVVVLADTSFGGDEPPGPHADSADDDLAHCAPGSLDTVGQVIYEGLSTISRRLRRIDRFADSPIAETEALRLEQLREREAAAQAGPQAGEAEAEAEPPEPPGEAQAAPEATVEP